MVQAPSLAAIEALSSAASTPEQLEILRQLKNGIVGHDQRKELVVRNGLLESLVHIIRSKAPAIDGSAIPGIGSNARPWTQEDELRLQAIFVLGSIASAGPAYLPPLLAVGAIKCLVNILRTSASQKLINASLRALKDISAGLASAADSADLVRPEGSAICDDESHGIFLANLRQPAGLRNPAQALTLVCEIIASEARDDKTRSDLVEAGILDTLAALLVSHSIADKHIDYRSSTAHFLPAPPPAAVPVIVSAIAAIIQGSAYRAHRFILSDAVKDLFLNFSPGEGDLRYMMGPKHGLPNADGSLLPPLHIPAHKSVSFGAPSSAFPALGGLSRQNGAHDNHVQSSGEMDHANAVIGWLLFFARSFTGRDRIRGLRLLALVNEAVDLGVTTLGSRSESAQKAKDREKQVCLLAVPLAVRLVQEANEGKSTEDPRDAAELKEIREQACSVLALLIRSNRELQTAAVQANVIKHLCPILRRSFDSVPLAKPMWSAKNTSTQADAAQPSRRLGKRGLPVEIMHAMHCRRGALEAVAAIAHAEDAYRKTLIDAGVSTCIIDSLKPFPPNFDQQLAANKSQMNPKDGNTLAVLQAACQAVRAMSRSVSLLRTNLVDVGTAKPIFELMKHPELSLQVAATNACANLVLEFSAMRDDLLAEGVAPALCDQARRSEPELRIASLWALKHLMMKATRDLRISTIENLGTGWIVNAIAGLPFDDGSLANGGGVSIGLSSSNAAGEQVDLLNPSSMDVDEPTGTTSDESLDGDEDEDGEIMYDEPSNTHYQASQLRSTLQSSTSAFNSKRHLASIRELEQDPALRARREDAAIQEQALNLVRNITHGDDCAAMLDYLFREIGHQKFFDLLISKLSPIRQGSPPIYPPTQLVDAAIHILVHIANGNPQHKQLLIAQRSLLSAMVPHFNHADSRVRVACVWVVNNLTWIEDESDRVAARARVGELRSCGIESAVRGLREDGDLDVRERVKTAVRQMEGL